MKNFESVSKKLQEEFVGFGDARALFDSLQEVHPDLVYYLGLSDNSYCKNVDFERTLVKSVTGQELSVHDRQLLSKLSVNQENHVAVIDLANDAGSFAKRATAKKKQETADVNLNWICPTPNISERLFSTVRHDFNDYRKKLLPMNLEGQMFLKENKTFWDVKKLSFSK